MVCKRPVIWVNHTFRQPAIAISVSSYNVPPILNHLFVVLKSPSLTRHHRHHLPKNSSKFIPLPPCPSARRVANATLHDWRLWQLSFDPARPNKDRQCEDLMAFQRAGIRAGKYDNVIQNICESIVRIDNFANKQFVFKMINMTWWITFPT